MDDETLAARPVPAPDLSHNHHGSGRELFGLFRAHVSSAEQGASPLLPN
nr:phosphogluconate dehydratase [uncultured bacterium]